MSFTEKIDVLEMLIEIIQQHEKRLDEITTELEKFMKVMEEYIDVQT
jgi:hypothetical protein